MKEAEFTSTPVKEIPVKVGIEEVVLNGDLAVPQTPRGMIVVTHGGVGSRHSPPNRAVARAFQRLGFATLLVDLLTIEEEVIDQVTGHLRFDIGLLSNRLIGVTEWLIQHLTTQGLRVGYLGISTGASVALVAAAHHPELVDAIVSQGGRPDLVELLLPQVQAPTLLLIGGEDRHVLELNQFAFNKLRCVKKLEIIHGATHLFEEPGKLEQVTKLAGDWFYQYIGHPYHVGLAEE